MIQLTYEEDWYRELVDELHAIVVEKNYDAQLALITRNWLLGNAMLEYALHWEKYGDKVVENIAQDIGLPRDYLFRCIQFARKYPEIGVSHTEIDVMKLPESTENKLPTWSYIKTYLLTGKEPCVHEWRAENIIIQKCVKCSKRK